MKIARQPYNYQFYLPNFLKFCGNLSHKLLSSRQFWKNLVHFAEINEAAALYWMLHYIGRVATLKVVPRNCLTYLKTTLIMGGRVLVLEFMWGIADSPHSHPDSWHFPHSVAWFLVPTFTDSLLDGLKDDLFRPFCCGFKPLGISYKFLLMLSRCMQFVNFIINF